MNPKDFKNLFSLHRKEIPAVSDEECDQYAQYFTILADWNQRINLVSRKSFDSVFAPHFVDSIYIADFIATHRKQLDVVDVGSGAGFPALIFAIRFPEVPLMLFEKVGKKRSFLEAVVDELQLPNVVIKDLFPDQKRRGLFVSRATFSGDKLFKTFARSALSNSTLVVCTSVNHPPVPSPVFKKISQNAYTLPLGFGERNVSAYCFT